MSSVSKPRVRHNRHKQGLNLTLEKLSADFRVISTRILEYETDEILYRKDTIADDEGEDCQTEIESYHPKATARLRAYEAGDEYEGLMTAEGHIVTMPLYKDIIAIGYDLYLCTSVNYDKLVVNGKGVQVK